jgi:hypothetical protein
LILSSFCIVNELFPLARASLFTRFILL